MAYGEQLADVDIISHCHIQNAIDRATKDQDWIENEMKKKKQNEETFRTQNFIKLNAVRIAWHGYNGNKNASELTEKSKIRSKTKSRFPRLDNEYSYIATSSDCRSFEKKVEINSLSQNSTMHKIYQEQNNSSNRSHKKVCRHCSYPIQNLQVARACDLKTSQSNTAFWSLKLEKIGQLHSASDRSYRLQFLHHERASSDKSKPLFSKTNNSHLHDRSQQLISNFNFSDNFCGRNSAHSMRTRKTAASSFYQRLKQNTSKQSKIIIVRLPDPKSYSKLFHHEQIAAKVFSRGLLR